MRARELRGDFSFGEQILDIADDGTNDWGETANGKPIVQKELVFRSKLRIEARRFHMERLHRYVWGEKVQTETHVNFNLLSKEELMQKARELIGMIEFINAPPPKAPPLVYWPEEAPDDNNDPGAIGR